MFCKSSVASTDGVCVIDSEGRFVDVNSSYCHLIDYSMRELLSMSILDIQVVETRQKIRKHIEAIVSGKTSFKMVQRCKGGGVVQVWPARFDSEARQALQKIRAILSTAEKVKQVKIVEMSHKE